MEDIEYLCMYVCMYSGEDAREVLYGTQNGKLGLVKLMTNEPTYRWDMLNEKKYGSISCISTSDITGDGLPDILVGRDDGVVEVYGFDDSDEPRLQYTHVSLWIPVVVWTV